MGPWKWRPIHTATERGDGDVIEFLLAKGAKATTRSSNGVQPIYLASESGYTKAIDLLIEVGASPNAFDVTGNRPLHLAWRHLNSPAVITALVNKGADIEVEAGKNGERTALQIACAGYDCFSSVQALVGLGARLNVEAHDPSPLYLAVSSRSHRVVDYLLRRGADPNARATSSGMTPILQLVLEQTNSLSRHAEMLWRLLEFNADIRVQDRFGNQVLHYLAFRMELPGLIENLLPLTERPG
ncbi:hypothetical protein MMC28_011496, partial [Mycoblastus sanguinarius]|nr:hypothetical protein [Mycoblastus sanguinarius]